MKICHYDNNQAGVIVEDKVYNIGDALIKAGLARNGYTMLEIIDALANDSKAMQLARDASQDCAGIPLNYQPGIIVGCGGKLPGAPKRDDRAHGQRRPSHQKQRRTDGRVLPQDDVVHHRAR